MGAGAGDAGEGRGGCLRIFFFFCLGDRLGIDWVEWGKEGVVGGIDWLVRDEGVNIWFTM